MELHSTYLPNLYLSETDKAGLEYDMYPPHQEEISIELFHHAKPLLLSLLHIALKKIKTTAMTTAVAFATCYVLIRWYRCFYFKYICPKYNNHSYWYLSTWIKNTLLFANHPPPRHMLVNKASLKVGFLSFFPDIKL